MGKREGEGAEAGGWSPTEVASHRQRLQIVQNSPGPQLPKTGTQHPRQTAAKHRAQLTNQLDYGG